MDIGKLFSDLTEKPPDKLLESDDVDQKMDTESSGSDVLSQSLDDSVSSSPVMPVVSMKSYASDSKNRRTDETTYNKDQRNKTENGIDKDVDSHKSQKKGERDAKLEEPTTDSTTTPLRRSSRANKGIGKEIFDPSYIPQKKYHETYKRFDSPSSNEKVKSPPSSTTSSPGRSGRIVIGQSPRRKKASDAKSENVKKSKSLEKLKDTNADQKSDTPTSTTKKDKNEKEREKPRKESKDLPKEKLLPSKPISKEDFSDEDDNVPLKQLKEEDDDEPFSSSSSSSSDTDSDADSDDSYNNPDRLWCICKKPHNNRFMISCDQCEEWYHGDCVGITLQRGKKMEENNEEYVCPKCVKKKYESISPYVPPGKEPLRRKSTEGPKDEAQEKAFKRSAALDEKLKSSGKSLKGYALIGQIQRSTTRPNDSGEPQRKRLKVFSHGKSESERKQKKDLSKLNTDKVPPSKSDSSTRKCIVSSCNNDALHGSVYCSNQCILRHAKESLKTITKEKKVDEKVAKKDRHDGKSAIRHKDPKKRIPVICKKTRKILTGHSAPYRRDLALFLKQNPSYEVYRSRHSSNKQEKSHSEPQASSSEDSKTVSSVDFYRHVESQNRKRDRYTTDPDFAPQAKKVSDSTSVEKKSRITSNVVKIPSQAPSSTVKSSSQSSSSVSKPHKQRKESSESIRKHEGSKHLERKDSKSKDVVKRKHSTDGSSLRKSTDDKAKKVERSHSASSVKVSSNAPKSEAKSSSTVDIRQSVKKSLFDILKSRSSSSEDLKMHHDSITRLATKIEESLYKVHSDTNTKYKNKYRSIMFNLKDARNHGLWRKVIIGDVTTSELVQMTAEQMASKKLAEWRQNELTQELDIIQKQEKEKANIRPVAKITHKGEIAIQEDLSDLTENFSNRDSTSAPTVAPARKKRISLSEEDPFEISTPLPTDTTNQHNNHLFDLNCKICTGKVKEETPESSDVPSETKKVKRSTSIILSSEAQQSAVNNPSSPSAPTSHIVISDKPRQKMKKGPDKVKESDVNSHDPSLSPASFLSKLSQEKQKKKKPILPSPPPLSDIADRESEEVTPSPTESGSTDKNSEAASVKIEEKEAEKTPPEEEVQAETKAEPVVKATTSKLIWSGSISMLELSTFKANVYPVNGSCHNLDIDLPVKLVLGGRIHPKVVWEYLDKVSTIPTKQLSVIRFHAAADEDRVGYVAMLSYFSSRKRFGVVSNQDRLLVKDMYLIPLLESQPIPDQLKSCSPGVEDSLPASRPSMLIGIVVRQSTKILKPVEPETHQPTMPAALLKREESPPNDDGDEEYVPGEEPLIEDKTPSPAPLLTDEELQSKGETKPTTRGSLFERNRSLAPSLRFFMRKQSEEEQNKKDLEASADEDQPYSPGEDIDDEGGDYDPADEIAPEEDEEPYDPEKMFPEEEEYDPETAFPPESPKTNDDIPYDPEEDEKLLKETQTNLQEQQAEIERIHREIEKNKAKLAEAENAANKPSKASESVSVGLPPIVLPPIPAPQPRVDPRLARRAVQEIAKTVETEPSSTQEEKKEPKNHMNTPYKPINPSKPTQSIEPEESPIPARPPIITEPPIPAEPSKPADPSKPIEPSKPTEPSKPVAAPVEITDIPKDLGSVQPIDPLQTILSVLNMTQSKNPVASSVAGALKIFQKPSSPPQLPDSTTKSDAEDTDVGSKDTSKSDSTGLVAYAVSPGSEDETKKSSRKDDRRRRSSSSSSVSSREGHRRHHESKKHRHHKRSRSRSPHRRGRHSPRHRRHDDDHRRRHDRSWGRDRRR